MESLSKVIENLEATAKVIEANTDEEGYVCITSDNARWIAEELRKSARSLRDGVMPEPPFIMAGTVKHSGDLHDELEEVDPERSQECPDASPSTGARANSAESSLES